MVRGAEVPDHSDVFLSYSRNDGGAAINLRGQLQRCGLNVFKDDERIRAGELWLNRLQEAVGECGAFVVLVGRDGVQRWIGAETQVALDRYFAPHEDAERLPIFPILLEGTEAETLPAFLRLFQMTPGTESMRCPNGCSTTSATAPSSPTRPYSMVARSSGLPPSALIKRTCSLGGRRRRSMRSPVSIPVAAPRPCAGWRLTVTRAPVSPR